MAHGRVTEDVLEQAAMYALGALDPDAAQAFEQHLREGCDVCESELRAFRETAALVGSSVPQFLPSARVRADLMARVQDSGVGPQVWKTWSSTNEDPLQVVRKLEGDWQFVCEGVQAKRLYADPSRDIVTMLIRMEPGSSYPPHRHGGAEQCLVLEGDLHVGDVVLHAGDFQAACTESVHDVSWTQDGCLLMIISSQHDQLLC